MTRPVRSDRLPPVSNPPSIMLSASEVALALADPFGLWHDHYGDPRLKDPEDEYALFLKEQGLRIEQELLAKRHGTVTDLAGLSFGSAAFQTARWLKQGHVVIHGGALESPGLGLRARPDVLQVEKGHCRVEEYKLAGTPDETHEIQTLVYLYLLRRGYGVEAEGQIVSRLNEVFPVVYDESRVREALDRARGILTRDSPPYPVYNGRSRWRRLQNKTAHDLQDVTLAWNVGPAHSGRFHRMGVHTLSDLAAMDPAAFKIIKGLGSKKIPQILNSVQAQLSKQVIRIGPFAPMAEPPELELFLDLEGTGELFQDDPAWNCIYLIGAIPREAGRMGDYRAFLAKQPADEKSIIVEFLEYLGKQTRRYRLYHWDHYERTQLRKACERLGLSEAFDQRILPYLEDLCRAAQASYVLPTPGYSIKVVAPFFGFSWAQSASEVDAMKSAMIWYKQAVAGGSGTDLGKVLRYNEDDCRAMIVVKDGLETLERTGPKARAGVPGPRRPKAVF